MLVMCEGIWRYNVILVTSWKFQVRKSHTRFDAMSGPLHGHVLTVYNRNSCDLSLTSQTLVQCLTSVCADTPNSVRQIIIENMSSRVATYYEETDT